MYAVLSLDDKIGNFVVSTFVATVWRITYDITMHVLINYAFMTEL